MDLFTEFWTHFWAPERFPLFKEVLAIQLLVLAALSLVERLAKVGERFRRQGQT